MVGSRGSKKKVIKNPTNPLLKEMKDRMFICMVACAKRRQFNQMYDTPLEVEKHLEAEACQDCPMRRVQK